MALRRAIAFVFGLLSLTGGETLWWVDIRPLPQWLVALPGLVLFVHAIWPRRLHRCHSAQPLRYGCGAVAGFMHHKAHPEIDVHDLGPVDIGVR